MDYDFFLPVFGKNVIYFAKAYSLTEDQMQIIHALINSSIPTIKEITIDDPNPKRLIGKAKKKADKKREEFDDLIKQVKRLIPGHSRIYVGTLNFSTEKLITDALEFEKEKINTEETIDVGSVEFTKTGMTTYWKNTYMDALIDAGMSKTTTRKMIDHIFASLLK